MSYSPLSCTLSDAGAAVATEINDNCTTLTAGDTGDHGDDHDMTDAATVPTSTSPDQSTMTSRSARAGASSPKDISAAPADDKAGDDGEELGKEWTGVSTLKPNSHKIGPGQPVLLVEQYCQPICITRRVFVSVLHVGHGILFPDRCREIVFGQHLNCELIYLIYVSTAEIGTFSAKHKKV